MDTMEIMTKIEDVIRRAVQLGAHLGDASFDEVLLANGFTNEERAMAIAYVMGRQHEIARQKEEKSDLTRTEGEA